MTEKKFEAVVFDMDGVIFDSEKIYRKFEMVIGKEYGFSEETCIKICEKIAGGTRESNKKNFAEIVGPEYNYYEYREKMIRMLDAYSDEYGFELKAGVKELLDYLKNKGVRMAIATSTVRERAEKHLKAHDIYDYFDEIVYGDTVPKGKPAPDIYLKACEVLDVNPENAIGIEDSINGVISSSTAGLHTVMVVDLIQPNDIVREKADEIFYIITDVKNLI